MKNTKDNFAVQFIRSIIQAGKDVHSVFQWERSRHSRGYKGYSIEKTYYGFRNLKRRGFLKENVPNSYRFTTKGKLWFQKSKKRYFPFAGLKWDRKWRIVIFDIPQELHKNRNTFRNKLKGLGFYMLQKSVFVIPYPCTQDLGYICSSLTITDYVDVITADSIGFKEKEIKKYFDL